MAIVFKCKMCGGDLDIQDGASIGICQYCSTQQTLPRLDNDRRANLYDRANHFRRNNEYDKAMSIYETILSEDGTDAEAFWSLVLCKYGIEYVEDPSTHRREPTCNRTQLTSIFADENYKQAVAHADGLSRIVYEGEAKAIDEIQKNILKISAKETPFDVFICYKEADASGHRTPDSVLAQDLYHQLIQEGFKVFFSRITLEDKLGSAYEPYIFAALQSAKVMVVVGTRPEHFNAVWVKNEWSRYLGLIKGGAKKTLIPAYRDMDPYELPEEFSHLQAQDMNKLGFMQDLVRGIRKLLNTDSAVTLPTTQANVSGNTAALLKRAFITLEDSEWQKADNLLEQVLNIDPENAKAYIGKLMAAYKINSEPLLANCREPLEKSGYFQRALRYADGVYCAELKGYNQRILDRLEEERQEAERRTELARQEAALARLEAEHRMEEERIAEERFKAEEARLTEEKRIAEEQYKITKAQKKKRLILRMVATLAALAILAGAVTTGFIVAKRVTAYNAVVDAVAHKDYKTAGINIVAAKGFKDVDQQFIALLPFFRERIRVAESKFLGSGSGIGFSHLAVNEDGTVSCSDWGYDNDELVKMTADVQGWRDIKAIASSDYHVLGLKKDGTVVATDGRSYLSSECDVSEYKNITAIACSFWASYLLNSNGTITALGQNALDVSGWTDIIDISVCRYNVFGFKKDGTLVVAQNPNDEFSVSAWSFMQTRLHDVVDVHQDYEETFLLLYNGTVVAQNTTASDKLRNIISITETTEGATVFIRSDGVALYKDGTILDFYWRSGDTADKYLVASSYTEDLHDDGQLSNGQDDLWEGSCFDEGWLEKYK